MNRNRTAGGMLATVLLAGVVSSACQADPVRAGSAALVDGERIPLSEVSSRVDTIMAARAEANLPELSSAEVTRGQLGSLLMARVFAKAAEEHGVSVTQGEVDARVADLESQLGGPDELRRALVSDESSLVAPDDLGSIIRVSLTRQKLFESFTRGSPDPQQRAQAETEMVEALREIAREMDVSVNPRFGEWRPEEGTVVAAAPSFLRQPGPENQPQPQPEQQQPDQQQPDQQQPQPQPEQQQPDQQQPQPEP